MLFSLWLEIYLSSRLLFNNENTLFASKLTQLENPFFCKMFITMEIYKIKEVILYEIKIENICFPVVFVSSFTANIF